MRSCMGGLAAPWAVCGRATYLRRRRLVTTAAARFSYAQPQRGGLARDWCPICKGQRLGLKFPHESAEFFSLVIKAGTWIRIGGVAGWQMPARGPLSQALIARSAMQGLA